VDEEPLLRGVEIIQLLLDRGAAIEAADKNGETALHKASSITKFPSIFSDESFEYHGAEVLIVQLFLKSISFGMALTQWLV
jgi:hypothetical protein